jgi:hypothetical protein
LLEKVLGPLAQLVEQLTLNQLVVGSIPTRPTISPLPSTSTDVQHATEICDKPYKNSDFLSTIDPLTFASKT